MIIRSKKIGNFTVLSNTCLKDKTLSSSAKGIFSYAMSLPDDWKFNKKELFSHFEDSTHSLNKGFKQLQAKGYIEIETLKNAQGQFSGSKIIFHEISIYDQTKNLNSDVQTGTKVAFISQIELQEDYIDINSNVIEFDDCLSPTAQQNNIEDDKSNSDIADLYIFDEVSQVVNNDFDNSIEEYIVEKAETRGELANDFNGLNRMHGIRDCGWEPLLNTNKKNTKEENKKTNKKIHSEYFDIKPEKDSVSCSFSFFDEKNKVVDYQQHELKEDLHNLGLSKSQINSVFRSYMLDWIDEAVTTTFQARYERKIVSMPKQYFYGVLKNLQSQQGVYANA